MKLSSSLGFVLTRALPVISSTLGPSVAYDTNVVGMPMVRSTDLEVYNAIEERIPTIHLGTFPLNRYLPKNDILFSIFVGSSTEDGRHDKEFGMTITATCVNCFWYGTAVVETTGVEGDDSLDVWDLITDPTEALINALDLNLEVQLRNMGGHFEFNIAFAATGTYTLTIFKTTTPVGVKLNGGNKVGLLFEIELIISATAQVNVLVGFDLVLPAGASLVLNPISGRIVSMNLGGVQVQSLPVKFKSGSACVSAIIRLKLSAGVSVDVLGYGFDFEAGVFFDPIQYKACVMYQPSLPCQVELTQYLYEEVAAYAKAVGDIEWADWSAGPTAITTFMTKTLPSMCLKTEAPKKQPHSTTVKKVTSAPAISETEKKASPTPKKTKAKTTASPKTKHAKTTTKKTAKKPTAKTTPPPTTTPHKAKSKTKVSSSAATKKPKSKTTSSQSATASYTSTSTSKASISSPRTRKSKSRSRSKTSTVTWDSSSGYSAVYPTSTSTQGAPYGNYSIPHSASSSTEVEESPIETPEPTPTDSEPEPTETPEPIPPPEEESTPSEYPGPSPTPTTAEPTPTSDLTTITFFSTKIYTIINCASPLALCPSDLATPIILTKTIIQYTTICPATQTDFPSPPSTSETASATTTETSPPEMNLTDAVELKPCPTPFISTVETITVHTTIGITIARYSPSITPTPPSTFRLPSSEPSAPSTTPFEEVSESSTSSSVETTSTQQGLGDAIVSIGGFGSSTVVETTSSSSVVAEETGQPDVFPQGGGVRRTPELRWMLWMFGIVMVVLGLG